MTEPALAAFAHGTSSLVGQQLVAEVIEAVGAARQLAALRLGYVDVQHPDIEETFETLDDAQHAVVVPLLLSAGYHVHVDLTRAVAKRSGPTTLAGALGPDPRLSTIMLHRLAQAGFSADDVLVLAVAGSSDARAVADCHTTAQQLAAASGREVAIGFLAAAEPRLDVAVAGARAAHPSARIVVASYLLAPGYFHDLAVAAGADVTTAPLLAEGEDAPAELVEIILERYDAVVAAL